LCRKYNSITTFPYPFLTQPITRHEANYLLTQSGPLTCALGRITLSLTLRPSGPQACFSSTILCFCERCNTLLPNVLLLCGVPILAEFSLSAQGTRALPRIFTDKSYFYTNFKLKFQIYTPFSNNFRNIHCLSSLWRPGSFCKKIPLLRLALAARCDQGPFN
jgi:hypothetical protein